MLTQRVLHIAHEFIWIPYCTKVLSLKGDIMVHHTLQIKGRWCIIGMWEAGQTQTVTARR